MIAQERKSVDSDDAGGDQEKSPVLTAQNDGRGKTNSTQHALLSTSMADNTLFTAVATSNKSTDDNTNTHRYREGDKHDDMYELAGEKISRSSTDDDLQGGRLPSATGVTVTTSSSHSEGESSLLAAAVKEEQDEATLLLPRLSCTTMNGSVPAAGDARTTRTTQVREQGDWSVAADKSLASTNSSSSTQKVAHLREKEALRSSMSSKQPAHDAELEQDGKQQHRGKLQSQGIKSEQTTQLPVEETNHPVSEPIQSSSASQYSKVNQENEQNSGQMIRSDTQKQPQQDPVIAHEHSEKVHSQQQQQPPLPKVQQRQKTSRQKGRFFVQPQVPQQQQQQQQMNHRSLPVSQQPPPLMPSKAAAEQPIFTTSLQLQLPRIVSRHQSLPIHQLQSATTPPPFAPPPPSPHNNHNGQSPPFPPTPDTIMAVAPPAHTQIGVISNSPLVSLPDANGQIVTKKKGRFKFLEQAPARVSGSAVEGAETGERQQHEWSSSTSAAPCNSASGMSGTNLEGTVAAPLINKKGRFVVTSVQAPAALTTSLPLVPVEQPTLQPPVPTRPDLAHQRRDGRASVIATAPSGQPVYAAAPPKDGTGAGAITMLQPPFQSGPPPGAIVVLPQPLPTSHRLSPVHMMASSAPPDTGSPSTYHQQPLLPTSEESGPSNGTSSSIATKHNKQPRAASTSRSTSSSTSGLAGQQGFGKMFYFLDQMRLEVTDADRKIKSFQTDMKFMNYEIYTQKKEKNKELEAKAREMERRWNQEKSLRETAEIKLKALKKQFRALKDDIQNVDFDTAKEDESVGTHQTGGMHSRTNSLDGTLEFLGNAGTGNGSMLLTVQETSKHTVTPPHPNSVNPATISTIDQTGRTPRDFSNKSPLRETATKSLQGLQQSPTAPIGYKIGETVGSSSPGPRSNTNEVGETNGSSKGNHPRQQQQQQQQSLGNLSNTHISGHANSTLQGDFIENSAQPVASTANLGAPPRPAANKTRHVGSGSFEPSWSDTFDFDPLRPVHQKSQGVDDGLVTTEPEQMQSKSTSTSTPPVCKINHNHMLTPSGLASEAAEDSDLMSFQPPMMVQLNLAHTDAYMSMSHNQQQSATKHQRTHSGRPVIPSQVTMKPYHDQPTMLAALAQGNQPQILMPMQQSVVQVPSQQYQQQQQQQQQQWATQQQYSNSTISQPDLLSGRQQTQNTGQTRSDPMTSLLQPKFESSSDPFDELVQKLRPSTNA